MKAAGHCAIACVYGLLVSQAEAQTTKPRKWVEPSKTCPQICQFRHGPGSRNQYSMCVANCQAYRIKMRKQ
jgi:hypothetical protein